MNENTPPTITDDAKRIDRYTLLELISVHSPGEQFDGYRQFPTELWRGHDEILDRPVSIRLMRKDDARLNRVLGAARAAALVDDRRLLRILDVLDVPGGVGEQARTAVVSEWASGQSLADRLGGGGLFDPTVALEVIVEISRTLATCAQHDVGHGRLRPTCVLWTEAGEVRVRGLAIDAALFGPIDPAAPDADIDGLGGLLYAMVTGRWPALTIDPQTVHIPLAPAAGRTVPMPSRVRAGMPAEIDDLVTRSVRQVARPRGAMPITSVEGFAAAAGSAIDYLAPVTTTQTTQLPKVGTLRLANGKPVQVGQFLSAGQLETLVYDAPATYRGTKPVFFRYLVSDGQYSTEATVEIRLVRSVRCQTADFGKGKGLKSMPASLAQESSQNGQKGKGAGKLRK